MDNIAMIAEQSQSKTIATFPQFQLGKSGRVASKIVEGGVVYTVVLDRSVIMPDVYLEMIHTLYTMRDCDMMIIKIYSDGGWVESGIDIIHAIKHTKGKVKGQIFGMCASIAAVIWSCCHIREIMPLGTLMYHMPSGGYFGKSMDVADETSQLCSYFKELLRTITKGILTEEDLTEVIDHRKDIYLSAETVQLRLNKLNVA